MPQLIRSTGFAFVISLTSLAQGQAPAPASTEIPSLAQITKIVFPAFPKLARSAHDARVVRVKLRPNGDRLVILDILGGNKYFDSSIRNAVSEWRGSHQRPLQGSDFWVKIDFRVSASMAEETSCEIDLDESTLVIYGKIRFTETEKLPVNTAK